jgi:hypothetical protein
MQQEPKHFEGWGGMADWSAKLFDKKPMEDSEWSPLIDCIMNRVKEAKEANPEKQIAVAFALFTKAMRDYIRKNSGFPVSFVQIDVSKEEYREIHAKSKRFL